MIKLEVGRSVIELYYPPTYSSKPLGRMMDESSLSNEMIK